VTVTKSWGDTTNNSCQTRQFRTLRANFYNCLFPTCWSISFFLTMIKLKSFKGSVLLSGLEYINNYLICNQNKIEIWGEFICSCKFLLQNHNVYIFNFRKPHFLLHHIYPMKSWHLLLEVKTQTCATVEIFTNSHGNVEYFQTIILWSVNLNWRAPHEKQLTPQRKNYKLHTSTFRAA
jgi:hypothetical protein